TPASVPAGSGDSLTFTSGSNVQSSRIKLQGGQGLTTGSVYYSFMLKINDISTVSASGGFVSAFNSSYGTLQNVIGSGGGTLASRLYMKKNPDTVNFPNTYVLGIANAVAAVSSAVFETGAGHAQGDSVQVVVGYTFTGGTDVANLWI